MIITGNIIAGVIASVIIVAVIALQNPATRQQRMEAAARWLQKYGPLLISCTLLCWVMNGVSGNPTAQWLLAIILCQPLSGWVNNALGER